MFRAARRFSSITEMHYPAVLGLDASESWVKDRGGAPPRREAGPCIAPADPLAISTGNRHSPPKSESNCLDQDARCLGFSSVGGACGLARDRRDSSNRS